MGEQPKLAEKIKALPGFRFMSFVIKAFDNTQNNSKEFVFELLRYAALVLFFVGGITSTAYTFPTIYASLNAYLPYQWLATTLTVFAVVMLFFAIDISLSVIFPFCTDLIVSGKSVRNWRTVIGSIFLLALSGCLAYISYNMSKEGGYTPAMAAVRQSKAEVDSLLPKKQPRQEVASATELERIFDERIEKLQEKEDARLQKLITQAHITAKSQRAWASTHANKNNIPTLFAQYSRDSAATVAKFKPDKKVQDEIKDIEAKKHDAILASTSAMVNVTSTIKLDKELEAAEDNRKISRIQNLIGVIGSFATILGLLLSLVIAFLKAGLTAPPSNRLFPAFLYLSVLKDWWYNRNNDDVDNQTVTKKDKDSNRNNSYDNEYSLFGNKNDSDRNTSKIVTVTDPKDGGTERMTLSEANTEFHAYKLKIEKGLGDTQAHAAYCRAIFDAMDYADSTYAQALKNRILIANDAPKTIALLGWR